LFFFFLIKEHGFMARRYGWPLLIFLLILGGNAGTWTGEALVNAWPDLQSWIHSDVIGFSPFTLNLQVLTVTFGLAVRFNWLTVLGVALAFFVYKRL
jgi:hypothetical protein